MSILRIRKYPDPVLRRKALPVKAVTEIERRLIEDMIETMKLSDGVGLAATQAGVPKRIIVFNPSCDEWRADALINPVISKKRGSEKKEEGCLSLPGINGLVRRSTYILVEGLDIKGRPVCFEAKDLLARIFQHEIDHLDGILFIDRINPMKRLMAKRKLKKELK
ncbi:MAG: peptide deformylase [Omnitrophica WOR_2 bacterium RIFCSPHIGHO2_01_FULL_49_10]|nr:MAG: peptide deformylase [Omnitrophica WOR_2 bacterium RIFCSPHIGHO2_01_FULL_49_10]